MEVEQGRAGKDWRDGRGGQRGKGVREGLEGW